MTYKSLSVAFGVFLVSVAVAGCGGGSGGMCGTQPCGGNVVGTWTISEACLASDATTNALPAQVAAVCPEAKLGAIETTVGGNMTFTENLSYTIQSTISVSAKVAVPEACTLGLTCAQVSAAVALLFAQSPDPRIQSVSCAGTPTCVCTVTFTPQQVGGAGTYTTSGNSLILSQWGAIDYCVRGNNFVMVDPPIAVGGMLDQVIAIVATKG